MKKLICILMASTMLLVLPTCQPHEQDRPDGAISGGSGFIAYIIAAIIIPYRPEGY